MYNELKIGWKLEDFISIIRKIKERFSKILLFI